MKILFVHPSVELYGADKILLYMLEILCEKNELTVLLPKSGIINEKIRRISNSINIIVDNNLPLVHSKLRFIDFIKLPAKIYRINHLFEKNKFDILYCNTLAVTLLLYTTWSKIKVIHIHEIIKNKFLNLGFSLLIRMKTKNVICVSNAVRRNLFFSRKYKIIHNGIPDIPKKFIENNVSNKIIFTLPGRFMPQKGHWFLIETLKLLSDAEKSQILIRLFGSPPPNRVYLEKDLIELIKQNGLEQIIELNNFIQDISKIYIDSNVILVPSMMADPFPTTVLEALEFSRPVISTNHGGAIEILDRKYSSLISPGNTEEFAEAIRFYINNKELLSEYSRAARNKFEETLTIQNFKTCFVQYLYNLLK